MFRALMDALWGAAYLVTFSFAPRALPSTWLAAPGGALGGLSGAAALLLLGGIGVYAARLYRAKDFLTAALLRAVVLLAVISSALMRGAHGPVLKGFWVVGPLVWMALASIVVRELRARGLLQRRAQMAAAAVLTLAVGAVSFALAWPRIGSREAMWRAVLLGAPGRESDAVAFSRFLEGRSDSEGARSVLAACVAFNPDACDCHARLTEALFDNGQIGEAAAIVNHAGHVCSATARFGALRAETLAADGSYAKALDEANAALARDPTDPHAVYAKALALVGKHDPGGGRVLAEQAQLLGRGSAATVLVGYVKMTQGDLDGAQADFERAHAEDPKEWAAVYNLAVIAERRGHYRVAREGYLEALRMNPHELSARYNLARLAHTIGADFEAKHHFEEFQKAAPTDARLASLRALIQ